MQFYKGDACTIQYFICSYFFRVVSGTRFAHFQFQYHHINYGRKSIIIIIIVSENVDRVNARVVTICLLFTISHLAKRN